MEKKLFQILMPLSFFLSFTNNSLLEWAKMSRNS